MQRRCGQASGWFAATSVVFRLLPQLGRADGVSVPGRRLAGEREPLRVGPIPAPNPAHETRIIRMESAPDSHPHMNRHCRRTSRPIGWTSPGSVDTGLSDTRSRRRAAEDRQGGRFLSSSSSLNKRSKIPMEPPGRAEQRREVARRARTRSRARSARPSRVASRRVVPSARMCLFHSRSPASRRRSRLRPRRVALRTPPVNSSRASSAVECGCRRPR